MTMIVGPRNNGQMGTFFNPGHHLFLFYRYSIFTDGPHQRVMVPQVMMRGAFTIHSAGIVMTQMVGMLLFANQMAN